MEKDIKEIPEEIWVLEFDSESAQKFREEIQAHAKGDPNKPVVVYIDSYGGQVDALAKMIETMDEVHNPIITVCLGKAMSCGAVLLSHGDIRFCGPHSRIMIHEVSSVTSGVVHDMAVDTHETERLNEWFLGLLARNCGYKGYPALRKIMKSKDGRDVFLNADDALKFGIIDVIGLPQVGAAKVFSVIKPPSKERVKYKVSSRNRRSPKEKTPKKGKVPCRKKAKS